MKVYKIKQVEKQVLEDVICDICSVSCASSEGTYEFAHIHSHWGYGSNNDGEITSLDICQSCLDKLGKQLNITNKLYKETTYEDFNSND